MTKFLVAPDKFKGSLTAIQVCAAIEEGIKSIDHSIEIISLPLADGGEGTCDLLTAYSRGSKIKVSVLNPLLNEIESEYGMSSDGKTAFIEMAKASGLHLLEHVDRNPLVTSTFGTGQLIQHAMEHGAKHIILGIGGSATNDAGIGMADALGFSFLSANGERLIPIGENLINIASIDRQLVHPLIAQTTFTVLCDVESPLYGPDGAAYLFASQKGASHSDIVRLDAGLKNFDRVARDTFGTEINFNGSGAAGGLGAGATVFLKATLKPGLVFIAEFTKLNELIRDADIVITGEGKIDEQTLFGKVVKGVADRCAALHKPCIAFTGACDHPSDMAARLAIHRIITLQNDSTPAAEAIANAFEILKKRAIKYTKEAFFAI